MNSAMTVNVPERRVDRILSSYGFGCATAWGKNKRFFCRII